ncbi:MAG: PhnD/SsuA/transferrin family substrate-binding protein [Deltaproteobacteria bacterium]|nr:PhnD/SsuA/transferrin family substrate-binding protein [Deltaproteobacteria bacterium]
MRKSFLAVAAALVTGVSLASPAASAGPRDVAISVTRIGGDTGSAQPFVDRFLRYVEGAIGWPAGSAKGSFLTTRKAVTAFVAANKPGIGMMDPPLFFEMRKEWDLKPLMQVESKDLVSPRLHVVVKDPGIRSLADLKGRRVHTTLGDYPRYLSKVVLGGQVDAGTDWQLKHVGQALKGIRNVLRGDADATLLDDEQLASARQIEGGGDLRTIFTSSALPAIPVVEFGSSLPPADRDAFVKAMLAMCGSAAGAAICKEMHIGRFVPLDKPALDAALTRYGQ